MDSRTATSRGRSCVTTCVFVNAHVVMDDLVAHADDVRPWNFGMSVGELPRRLPRGFANDLNEMNQREATVLVRIIRLA